MCLLLLRLLSSSAFDCFSHLWIAHTCRNRLASMHNAHWSIGFFEVRHGRQPVSDYRRARNVGPVSFDESLELYHHNRSFKEIPFLARLLCIVPIYLVHLQTSPPINLRANNFSFVHKMYNCHSKPVLYIYERWTYVGTVHTRSSTEGFVMSSYWRVCVCLGILYCSIHMHSAYARG